MQREVGRSSYGAIFVNRQGTGARAGRRGLEPRLRRRREHPADARTSAFSAFIARTDTPETARPGRAAATTPAARSTTSPTTCGRSPAAIRRSARTSIPRSASCRAAATAARSSARSSSRSRRTIEWIRRIAPHVSLQLVLGLRRASCRPRTWHIHPFEIQPKQGGRFGWFFDYAKDNPTTPFTVFNRDGRRVAIPAGQYAWGQNALRVPPQPERARHRHDPLPHRQLLRRRFQQPGADQRVPDHAARRPRASAGRARTSSCRTATSSTTWCRSRRTTRSRR